MISPTMPVRVFGIIPAAGSSRRMGRPKSILPYGESTMVGAVARSLLDANLDGVVVVTRSELVGAIQLPEDSRLSIGFNDAHDSEMLDSIRIGLTCLAEVQCSQVLPANFCIASPPIDNRQSTIGNWDSSLNDVGVLIVPADMPAIRVETYRACIAVFAGEPQSIVMAANGGKRGHPIIFPGSLAADVLRLRHGLHELAQLHPDRVRLVETGDPGVTRDVDSPDDYEELHLTNR